MLFMPKQDVFCNFQQFLQINECAHKVKEAWNKKANNDYKGNKKEVWAFVGRKIKARREL